MEKPSLSSWTLSVRLEGNALEFTLGDGRRLAWRARRPAELLQYVSQPASAADLFGTDLAARLAGSAPRPLSIIYGVEAALDVVEWEQLGVGTARMAEQFALTRQFFSDSDVVVKVRALAETLNTCVVHAGIARPGHRLPGVAFDTIDQPWARATVANAHVLLLDCVPLAQCLERIGWSPLQRLIVLAEPPPTHVLADVLDAGATVLCLARPDDLFGEPIELLLRQLGSGLSVGEAVRWIHRNATRRPFEARLYGDPELCFVRMQVLASLRQVTSLSFDMVGSTAMITRLGVEAYAEMLAAMHGCCADIVRRHGGQLDDPQGNDGLMVFFGYPMSVEGSAVHAVEAALSIVRAVAELGVMVRVGVATGPVAIRAGQPVGMSIHLAARLQQAAAPGTVLVSDATCRLVAHAFDLAPVTALPQMKGIDKSEIAYHVSVSRRGFHEHRLERLPSLAPMIGRHAELESLHQLWQMTCEGAARLAVVSAEAGMGKSRLVLEFRRQLALTGVHVLECRCRADASASPFLTLAEALKRWLDINPDDAPEQALCKLELALPEHARDDEAFGRLLAILGLQSTPLQAGLSPARVSLLELLVDWFHVFARGQRCCLIVEDWHWVDPSMREFVEYLVDGRGGPGLLVVITVRTEATPVPSPFVSAQYDHIELTGLRPEAARELVNMICGDTPLPPRLVRLLAERGDGVPLFLEEAARMTLEYSKDGANIDGQALERVPESLQDLLTARLDAMGVAKPVAQVAAVLGRQFSRALLLSLLVAEGYTQDAAALDERLGILVSSGLVRPEDDGRFAFRHALIRDAAYASLWARDRQALHGRVVTLLKERWPELLARRPELLALHLTEASLHAQALAQWELSAWHAAARCADLEAISHLHRALSVLALTDEGVERDRTALRLQLLLAARLIAAEGYGSDSVLQAYLEAERLCDRMGDDTARFKVEMGLEAYRFMRADFAPALEHGRRAAAIAARSGDVKQRLHAHWGLACTWFHQGELCATMREMEMALAIYTPAMHPQFGLQDPGVMCMAYSSWGLWEMCRPDAALERIDRAVTMAREFEHRFSQAVALSYGVSIQLLRGETDAALARADESLRVCGDANFPVWLAITRCMRGYLLCERGEFSIGLAEMSAGYAQWLATGAVVSQPLYLSLQVEGLILAGQIEEAAARVDDGLAIIKRHGERQLEAELTRLRGEIELRRGNAAAGEAWLKRAYLLAMRQHRLGFALRSATSLARLWLASGRGERAKRILVPLAARWSEGRGTRDLRAAEAVLDSLN